MLSRTTGLPTESARARFRIESNVGLWYLPQLRKPSLASQIHALGLKFGIYEAIGTKTCQNLPGSGGATAAANHYAQDAATFRSWGVDYVKIDECGGLPSGTTLASLTTAFQQYGADLKADNPSVVYSEELPIFVLGQSSFDTAVQSSSTSNVATVRW